MPEFAAHLTTDATTLTDAQLDDLTDGFTPTFGAPGVVDGRLTVQLTVNAPDLVEAGRLGVAIVDQTLHDHSIPGAVVAVEVMTVDEFDRWLTAPQRPTDLVSTSEAAAILGVSRQRVTQLAGTHPDFPPTVTVAGTLFWSRSALRRFDKARSRRPGPRAATG